MAGTVAVTTALIAAAFAVGRRPRPPLDRAVPRSWLVAAVAVANLFLAALLLAATRTARRASPGSIHHA
jgi:multisubunit Na+/H+ antiporter MnhB subunit